MVIRWLKVQWDRSAAAVLAIIGFVSLLVGYLGVSRSLLPTQQIPYLASGGLFGLFALGLAGTLWLSADLRDEWRKLDEISRKLDYSASDSGESNGERAVPSRAADRSR